jgi:hypothetical protein
VNHRFFGLFCSKVEQLFSVAKVKGNKAKRRENSEAKESQAKQGKANKML